MHHRTKTKQWMCRTSRHVAMGTWCHTFIMVQPSCFSSMTNLRDPKRGWKECSLCAQGTWQWRSQHLLFLFKGWTFNQSFLLKPTWAHAHLKSLAHLSSTLGAKLPNLTKYFGSKLLMLTIWRGGRINQGVAEMVPA